MTLVVDGATVGGMPPAAEPAEQDEVAADGAGESVENPASADNDDDQMEDFWDQSSSSSSTTSLEDLERDTYGSERRRRLTKFFR